MLAFLEYFFKPSDNDGGTPFMTCLINEGSTIYIVVLFNNPDMVAIKSVLNGNLL